MINWTTTLTSIDPETFLFPDPVHPLEIHLPAFTCEVTPHAAATGAGFPCSNPPDRGGQARVVIPGTRLIALTAAWLSKRPAGPALAHFQTLAHSGHRLSLAGRAYHFPSATSLRMAMSSAWSATSFFRRIFSFSSSLSSLSASFFTPEY